MNRAPKKSGFVFTTAWDLDDFIADESKKEMNEPLDMMHGALENTAGTRELGHRDLERART